MSLVKYRRDLHQIPEIAHHEFKTHDYILNVLDKLNCTIHTLEPTGIVAYFDFNKKNTIAFRSDMDALYIEEKNVIDYNSKHTKLMHACGHDGHMAVSLEFAVYFNTHQANNNIVLIFQPAEESITGANIVIESGLLEKYNVKAVFGFHIWPNLEKGKIFTKPGPIMAKASELTIEVFGKSIHVANATQGIDSLKISTELLNNIYNYEETLDKDIVHLLKFGKMESGTIRNIISSYTKIEGTLRCYDNKVFDMIQNDLQNIVNKVEQKYNNIIKISYGVASSPVINNQELLSKLNLDTELLEKPVLQAEDFGNYSNLYPSVFFFLGVGNTTSLHTEDFDFDDSELVKVVELYKNIANKKSIYDITLVK
jgi:hippurate hydrolase